MNPRSTLPRLPRIGPAALLWFSLLPCAMRWGTALAGEAEDALIDSSRDPLAESLSERDHLLGDLGGLRTRLVEKGVHFQAGYIGEVLGNVSGGRKRGTVYEGLAEVALDLDLERITGGWKGALFRVSGLYPHGQSPSGELIGDLQTASNIDSYDTPNLYELWVEQNIWENRLSVRVGQLLADAEFTGTSYGGTLLNSSFGWPAFISGNTLNTGPAFAKAALGIRVRVEPTPAWFVQTGVYDGDTFDDPSGRPDRNPHGTHFELSRKQGAFAIAETGWRFNEGADSGGLPGTYKFGAWLHTAEFADRFDADETHDSNHGIYLAAEQMVWREPAAEQDSQQGFGLFFRAGASPSDRNLFEYTFDTGLHYLGLLPGRDDDAFAVGVAFVKISDDFRRAERAAGAGVISDYELALEVSYQINLAPWWSLQPDVQWIHHPGGSRALDDAIVLGLRTRLTF